MSEREQLYKKVQHGKTVRYVAIEGQLAEDPPEPVVLYNLDEREALTAAGALGVTLLHIFQRHIPSHKVVARKIQAVEFSILDLYKGTGKHIDDEIADGMFRAWDLAMKIISDEKGV